MEWKKDRFGWWDYKCDGVLAAVYRVGGKGMYWHIVWGFLTADEVLPINEYTEDQVRHHIELKYKLLRGEHG
jgi:hypothetical protein